MIINSQGFKHFLQHVNNQDFFYETPRMLLILDGCSSGKYSEVGTRLFTQIFSRKEENDSVEKFESNVKEVFDELIEMMRKYYPEPKALESDFIMENLLFTIIACFDCKDKFVVKMFGDGYIITQNRRNRLSYMKFSYGKCPPYFAYKYCELLTPNIFRDYKFKAFEFDKKIFKSVGIASDGILPLVKCEAQGMETYILRRDKAGLQMSIRMQNQAFGDDVTIALFDDENPDLNMPIKNNATEKSFNTEVTGPLVGTEKIVKEDETMKKLEITLFGEKPVRKSVVTNKDSVSDDRLDDKSISNRNNSKLVNKSDTVVHEIKKPVEKEDVTKTSSKEKTIGGK